MLTTPSKTFYETRVKSFAPIRMCSTDSLELSVDINFTTSNGDITWKAPYGTYHHNDDQEIVLTKAIYGFTVTVEPRYAVIGGENRSIVIKRHEKPMVKEIGIDSIDVTKLDDT